MIRSVLLRSTSHGQTNIIWDRWHNWLVWV